VSGQLAFTTDYRDASGCDVLYASGSLQYLPVRIDGILSSLAAKPRRIVLNTTAVHPERTLYTLNSIGVAVCPYRIEHHEGLLATLTQAGYKRRDVWRNEGKPIEVPFVERRRPALLRGRAVSTWPEGRSASEGGNAPQTANSESRFANDFISIALPDGSRKNIVACSPGSPLKRM
jgi:hypothetical protein